RQRRLQQVCRRLRRGEQQEPVGAPVRRPGPDPDQWHDLQLARPGRDRVGPNVQWHLARVPAPVQDEPLTSHLEQPPQPAGLLRFVRRRQLLLVHWHPRREVSLPGQQYYWDPGRGAPGGRPGLNAVQLLTADAGVSPERVGWLAANRV